MTAGDNEKASVVAKNVLRHVKDADIFEENEISIRSAIELVVIQENVARVDVCKSSAYSRSFCAKTSIFCETATDVPSPQASLHRLAVLESRPLKLQWTARETRWTS